MGISGMSPYTKHRDSLPYLAILQIMCEKNIKEYFDDTSQHLLLQLRN